jgi:hypothetical protein
LGATIAAIFEVPDLKPDVTLSVHDCLGNVEFDCVAVEVQPAASAGISAAAAIQ